MAALCRSIIVSGVESRPWIVKEGLDRPAVDDASSEYVPGPGVSDAALASNIECGKCEPNVKAGGVEDVKREFTL